MQKKYFLRRRVLLFSGLTSLWTCTSRPLMFIPHIKANAWIIKQCHSSQKKIFLAQFLDEDFGMRSNIVNSTLICRGGEHRVKPSLSGRCDNVWQSSLREERVCSQFQSIFSTWWFGRHGAPALFRVVGMCGPGSSKRWIRTRGEHSFQRPTSKAQPLRLHDLQSNSQVEHHALRTELGVQVKVQFKL